MSVVLALVLSGSAYAQITIESDEIDVTFGALIEQYTVADTVTVGLGTTGGPQQWTFTEAEFPGGSVDTLTVVDPATTPLADAFAEADFAWFIPERLIGSGDTTMAWTYFNRADTALLWLGAGGTFMEMPFAAVNTPPFVSLPFPATLNTSWVNDVQSVAQPSSEVRIEASEVGTQTIDAYGTITVPLGTFESLRIREERMSVTRTLVNGQVVSADTTNRIIYMWVVETHGLIATVTSLDGETDPNFTEAASITVRAGVPPGGPVAIEEAPPSSRRACRLHQSFPNPFNPSATITFDVTQSARVDLDVLDVAGRKVASVVSGRHPAGMHRVTFEAGTLPSGVYFYRLTCGGVSSIKTMTLVR